MDSLDSDVSNLRTSVVSCALLWSLSGGLGYLGFCGLESREYSAEPISLYVFGFLNELIRKELVRNKTFQAQLGLVLRHKIREYKVLQRKVSVCCPLPCGSLHVDEGISL